MNLVLITSCVYQYSGFSFYDPETRLKQLVELTIDSIRKKIPNSYIVILEGSELSSEEIEILKNNSDQLFLCSVNGLDKSSGEISLIYNFLNSLEFKKIHKKINNLIKISGRYYLLENYNFNMYDGCVIKNNKKEWSNEYASETRYYKVSKNKISDYINNLNNLITNGIHRDIEHSFYFYNVVTPTESIDKIGVGGFCGVDGSYVED